jgi:flagellar biosynthesis anti-sigma factor FlgM
MEISRYSKPVVTLVESTGAARGGKAAESAQSPAGAVATTGDLPLERMQAALRAMPEVDMAKVQAIKQALQRGEISTDPAKLAAAILAFHRGNGA